MHYLHDTLPNGLRIIHIPCDSSVSYCGFAVDCGSRDESSVQEGMAHFVEHMIFKGTARHRSSYIINRMESVGGELNAYTSKEETFVYSIFMEDNFIRACELLCDLVLHSSFPTAEIQKETDVILDEISSYEDNPPELIFDVFENLLFAGHPLGHNILGTEESLLSFSSLDGQEFLHRWYHPDNMIFFSSGRTDFKKIRRTLEKFFHAEFPAWKANSRTIPVSHQSFNTTQKRETHQAHVLIGNRAYNMYDDSRSALALLTNIIGGPGMNSRLNLKLREKKGLVYNVEANYTPYTDTGVFSIYFGTDSQKTSNCIELVHNELKRLRETALTATQLEAAKKQIRGQIGVSSDNRENIVMAMAKSFLHYNHYDSTQEVFERIERISSADILKAANDIFDESSLSSLIYV